MRKSVCLVMLVACGYTPAQDPGAGDDQPPSPDAPGIDPATCGMRPGSRGYTNRSANVAGLDRTYHVYLPANADPRTPMPLVIVHHGYTMSGDKMHDITDWDAIADAEGVALAFPDGQGGPDNLTAPWNVGTGICPSFAGAPPDATGDDFALLDYIKADISADQCIDTDHMFLTGFSMGGYFAHHVGCERSDFAGVAPHSGGTHALDSCSVAKKPIIIFHGKADPVIPTGCNDPESTHVINVTPAADAWAQHNGCAATYTKHAVTGGTCYHYDGCPAGGQVELCTFDNMGHCWAGGDPASGIYSCPSAASATQLEWDFWKTYAW